ncbi:hypothetical protein C7S20_12465 [Christiangramia fulva]|uniref:Uncharacterized protein n=1 Tax=Christiangramia fulva TaxID=2126553 RepID=A0A2R3Z725_9FLAO|nr:hypothetical protein [Christiangramia fulva]AVR46002.1 hypothetical protein C7S20_12465 [Christiangramia fulva]
MSEEEIGKQSGEESVEELQNSEKIVAEDLPKLYSKRVIYAFSIIFSTLFGTILLMSNLKQTGNKKGWYEVLIFGVIFTAGVVFTAASFNIETNIGLPLNLLGALILNEYFWNRYIGKETKFEKKSWHKPAIISLVITLPLIYIILTAGAGV